MWPVTPIPGFFALALISERAFARSSHPTVVMQSPQPIQLFFRLLNEDADLSFSFDIGVLLQIMGHAAEYLASQRGLHP
jgi:hypothetical protein